jgi:hypothetical protein
MRIRLALNSHIRPCGCLVGVYETYAGEVVEIVDAHGEQCPDPAHRTGTRSKPNPEGRLPKPSS